MAELTASLARLRADFNAAFPGRDRATDGWIGDAAHRARASGHNPDDTAGSRAEYSDGDSKPEVRALDVDDDLRDPRGVGMQDVINHMLASPNDLRRLSYIIFNRTIRQKRNGWRAERYTGENAHTEHAHFSGDPAYDEDASQWSVADFKEDDMANTWTEPLTQGPPGIAGQPRDNAMAYIWLHAHNAAAGVARLEAAAVADEARDRAMLAAIQALAAATGADTQPILDAIDAVREEAREEVIELRAQLAAEKARGDRLAAALTDAGVSSVPMQSEGPDAPVTGAHTPSSA